MIRKVPTLNGVRMALVMDHEFRMREFRGRQWTLAFAAIFELILFGVTAQPLFGMLAVMFLQTATDEARRFRRTGCALQTRRSIWKGTTPIDVAARPLLDGWTYVEGHPK